MIALTYVLTSRRPASVRKESRGLAVSRVKPWRDSDKASRRCTSARRRPLFEDDARQGAHYILTFGEDSDLRRWGLRLAERGGKTRRNERLLRWPESWRYYRIGCGRSERYEPLRNSHSAGRAAAQSEELPTNRGC